MSFKLGGSKSVSFSYKFIYLFFLNQVFDRKSKRLVEEIIDSKIVLSMRAIYQSKFGLALIDTGTQNQSDKLLLFEFYMMLPSHQ